jgi:hypothetical protein
MTSPTTGVMMLAVSEVVVVEVVVVVRARRPDLTEAKEDSSLQSVVTSPGVIASVNESVCFYMMDMNLRVHTGQR